jgi:Icc-related predicted phosphoesterase
MFSSIRLSFIFSLSLIWRDHRIQSSSSFTSIEAFRSSPSRPVFTVGPKNKPLGLHQLKDTAIVDVLNSDPYDAHRQGSVTFQQPSLVAVVIDFENVRGYNGFLFGHDTMLSLIEEWGSTEQLCNRALIGRQLFLVVDHGNSPTSIWVPYNTTSSSFQNGYAVVFAGCNCKADDTIVHDVLPYILSSFTTSSINRRSAQSCVVQIVTADRLLIQRCRRVLRDHKHSSGSKLKFMKKGMVSTSFDADGAPNPNAIDLDTVSPKVFLSQLEKFHQGSDHTDGKLDTVEMEHVLRNETIPLKKSTIVSKQRHRGKRSKLVYKKETTEDRIVLAEALRKKLEHSSQSRCYSNVLEVNNMTDKKVFPLSQAYASYTTEKVQASQEKNLPLLPGDNWPSSLRLVVVSDTHGFESQLELPLPDGDVLLHLGDFAVDNVVENTNSNRKKGAKSHRSRHDGSQLADFDAWMSQQPHRLKIVLRGNHDPKSMAFLHSGATYITQPTSMDIAGFKFAFVPYQTAAKNGLRHKTLLPKTGCDVIVSHVPPFSILDCCYTGKSAGSTTLLKSVQHMNGNDGPPILWLCGHIHESRGVARDVVLCKKTNQMSYSGMTIVNAACANIGHARHLEYGSVLLELSCGQKDGSNMNGKKVQVLEMDGQYEFLNSRNPNFFQKQVEETTNCLLLAVDLGLRTGVSLFDQCTGRLLRFEHFQYESIDSLEIGARNLLQTWEDDLNAQSITRDMSTCEAMALGSHYRITHVAIEGSDPPLLDAWNRALGSKSVGKGIRLLLVTPNEWRTDLLTSIERQSGESAKKASQRISQLIIKKQSNVSVHSSSIDTSVSSYRSGFDTWSAFDPLVDLQATPSADVAESILLGFHVLRRLARSNVDRPNK